MKKIRVLRYLIILLVNVAFAFHARAATDVTIDGIGYWFNRWKNSYEVQECAKDVKVVRILPEIENNGRKYPVTSINGGFSDLPNLEEIYIPSSIKLVAQRAFGGGLDNLKKVEFESLESLCSIQFESSPMLYTHTIFINGEEQTEVTIPSSVTHIYNCFAGVTNLRYVKIPDSVIDISYGAFEGCTGLEEIEIGESVEYIGWLAFAGCTSLTHISLPESTTKIGDYIFEGCSNLESVDLPPYITEIPDYAFHGCNKLSRLKIPNSVTSFGNYAFEGCSSLENINLPDSLTKIGKEAFKGCESLISIEIPDSITIINEYMFLDCSSLTSVKFPLSLTEIEKRAFKGCSKLASLNLPANLKTIGIEAFAGCSSLKELTIPQSVRTIHQGAFAYCSELKSLIIEDAPYIPLDIDDSSLPDEDTSDSYEIQVFYATSLETLYFGRDIRYLGKPETWDSDARYCTSPFHNLKTIKTVTFGNTVTGIADYLFSGCSGLTEMTIPGNIGAIFRNAFRGCTGIKKLVIEDSTSYSPLALTWNEVYVGDFRFYYSALFGDCPLETLYVGRELKFFYKSTGYGELIALPFDKTPLKSIVFGDRVTSLSTLAFSWCTKIKEIIFGSSMTTIEKDAFFDCFDSDNLDLNEIPSVEVTFKSVNPPNINENFSTWGVYRTGIFWVPAESLDRYRNAYTTLVHVLPIGGVAPCVANVSSPGTLIDVIPNKDVLSVVDLKITGNINGSDIVTLNKMTSLRNLDLSEANFVSGGDSYYSLGAATYSTSDDVLGSYWAHNLSWLTELKLPASITKINAEAFYGLLYMKEIIVPKGVTEIGDKAFSEMKHLESVSIPEGVVSTGKYLFYGCPSLTTVNLPESLTEINEGTFNGCPSLSEITLPNTLTHIGREAFSNCTSLKTVVIPSSVKILDEDAFEGCTSLQEAVFIDTPSERSSLLTMSDGIFYHCPNLTSLNIPSSVKYVGNIFDSPSSVKQLILPGGLKKIHFGSLTEKIYLLSPIPPIVNKYIYQDISIPKVDIFVPAGSESAYRNDSYWSQVKNIRVWNCGSDIRKAEAGITYHVTSSTARTVEVSSVNASVAQGTFSLPETVCLDGEIYTVTGIANEAVQNCKLTSVSLNPSCGYIGLDAFKGCAEIKEINCEKTVPCPGVRVSSFEPNVVESAKVLVREEDCVSYIEDPDWRNFLINYTPETKLFSVYFVEPEIVIGVEETYSLRIQASYPAPGFPLPAYPPGILISCTDPEVVEVDRWCLNQELKVKALKEGKCILTATALDGSNETSQCVVRVEGAGVDEINADTILTDSEVEIFNPQGVMVFKGIYSDAVLDNGLHIVKQGNKTKKILVK